MRYLGWLMIVFGIVVGYFIQDYTLPRIGLDSLDRGQYMITVFLLTLGQFFVVMAKLCWGDQQ